MPRFDGLDHDLFESCIADLSQGHKATARILTDFLIAAGNHPYAEGATVDGKQKKYNFATPIRRGAWVALWGNGQKSSKLGPCLSIDVEVSDANAPKNTALFTVVQGQPGWRRLWLTIDDPTATQIDDLKRLLTRLHDQLT